MPPRPKSHLIEPKLIPMAKLKQTALLFALLALSVLLFPQQALAQDVPVVTEDVELDQNQVGDSIKVPIEVSNLDAVANIESFQFDVDFPSDQVVFDRFDISNTLVEESGFTVKQTDSADANAAGTTTFGGFFPDQPLNASGTSGTLAKIVFVVSGEEGGTVTFPSEEFTFENGRVAPDLSDADFEVIFSTNQAPSATDDNVSTGEESPLSQSAPGVLGNDSDSDGDGLTVTEVEGALENVGTEITLNSGALLTLDGNGAFTYDPNGQFADLGDGETATDFISYTVADGAGATDQGSLSVTVNGANDAPTITAIGDTTVTEDKTTGPLGFTVGDAETDPANLTVQASADNASLVPSDSIDLAGSGADQTVTVTPIADSGGTASITVTVADPGGMSTSTSFVLTVEPAISISEARSRGTGASVTVEGTVTRALGGVLRMQDASGATGASGLRAEVPSSIDASSLQQGVRIQLTGTLSETSGGVLQVAAVDIANALVEGSSAAPDAQEVRLATLRQDGEDYESELVRVEGISFSNPDTTGGTFESNTPYTVVDEKGTALDYWVAGSSTTELVGVPINPGTFTYTGVVGQSSSGYRLEPVRTSTSLPVELASFDAVRNGSSVQLTWQTASETNNAGFRVQHSAPNQSGWNQLGYVESKAQGGTATEANSYSYVIRRGLAPGTHQVRLQQVDLDGATTIAGKTAVTLQMEGALTVTAPAPNPTSGQATMSFGVKEASETEVVVYNVLGQQVKTLYDGTPQGGQTQRLSFDASSLPSGTYFVQVRSEENERALRLTVVQ